MVVGWYHSHPGFGCWLSGVDINTQQVEVQTWSAEGTDFDLDNYSFYRISFVPAHPMLVYMCSILRLLDRINFSRPYPSLLWDLKGFVVSFIKKKDSHWLLYKETTHCAEL